MSVAASPYILYVPVAQAVPAVALVVASSSHIAVALVTSKQFAYFTVALVTASSCDSKQFAFCCCRILRFR